MSDDKFLNDMLYGGSHQPRNIPRQLSEPRSENNTARELTWDDTTSFDHLDDHYTPHIPAHNNADRDRSERKWRRWFRLFRGQE